MRTGLIGWPLEHSLSPLIHNTAYEIAELNGTYSLFPIDPSDRSGLEKILLQLRNGNLNGLNVTIPLKVDILQFLDKLDPSVSRYQAANTLYMREGNLWCTNTDGLGFIRDITANFGTSVLESSDSIIFGNGGAAKAVCGSLLDIGNMVTIVVRNPKNVLMIMKSLINSNPSKVKIISFSDINQDILDSHSLIINATPLGMFPRSRSTPLPESIKFRKNHFVYDLVYNPSPTMFVQNATADGAIAVNGFGMLVEQALLAFYIWTGIDIPRDLFYSRYKNIKME